MSDSIVRKSMADMRANTAPAPLPKATTTVTLVEGQHILDEIEKIGLRVDQIVAESGNVAEETGERTGPPLKAGQKGAAQLIEAEQAKIREAVERLATFQYEIELTGTSAGEWHMWKDSHPPREDAPLDAQIALGWCNSADLFGDLGKYVSAWDGEPVQPGDWDKYLAERITYADRRDLVTKVVEMFEKGVKRVPFSSTGSSTTASSETA